MEHHPHQQSDRAFGYTFAGVFLLITLNVWWWFGRMPVWTLVCSALFAAAATVKPGVLMPLNRMWQVVTPKIARLTNALVLGVSFYVVVTPVGLVMRLMRRDPLQRSHNADSKTYWEPVAQQGNREAFFDLF